MAFIWKYAVEMADLLGIELPQGSKDIFSIYELLPAFICALIAIIVVSLLTKAHDKEITEEYISVTNEMNK